MPENTPTGPAIHLTVRVTDDIIRDAARNLRPLNIIRGRAQFTATATTASPAWSLLVDTARISLSDGRLTLALTADTIDMLNDPTIMVSAPLDYLAGIAMPAVEQEQPSHVFVPIAALEAMYAEFGAAEFTWVQARPVIEANRHLLDETTQAKNGGGFDNAVLRSLTKSINTCTEVSGHVLTSRRNRLKTKSYRFQPVA